MYKLYREFYKVHCEVEKGIADFDLHGEEVNKLKRAQEAIVQFHRSKNE